MKAVFYFVRRSIAGIQAAGWFLLTAKQEAELVQQKIIRLTSRTWIITIIDPDFIRPL
ncbi:hypothetical protein [Enterobacter bugandensis]